MSAKEIKLKPCPFCGSENVSMIKLGTYTSEKAAEYAFQILLNSISGGKEICYMPQDDEIQAAKVIAEKKYRHIDGKKTKGHGGS